ncbi:TauD/TfdA family dioxygenase [Frankia sp. CNm7]|uniref:TauD/TfdA family dioxygenase n=1 Tax=Frankia nepalensis TaxID=1836974 RepID=A0A937URG8_9ACTN|nr:TauD/TfdA family dioxygenase [Frankia nepalensis]MBL7501056.1 TauD/TfdA family dioxygenase [Frankia nepalensis]MBL7512531.1 TauD/TfdA family dioxygenase [Frankia nepalensis]MBL7520865.1 TauD/TfdA family dioxygenase [Frankia nepalensis]MBL7632849.1 TauD/TfdA family dioxygenase [Frankia nepalensis]
MSISVTQLSPRIGVEITGLTGRDLVDRTATKDCQAALDQHGVVVYREVHIDDTDLVAFSRMLGEVVVPKVNDPGEHSEIARITLDPTKSVLAGYRQGNFLWHIDGATDELPQKGTLLTAREVDPAGGDTEFANTYAAYAELSDEEKAEIADLQVVHSFAAAQRVAYPDATDKQRAGWDKVPSRVHPLVWTRRNGRRSLLIGATAGAVVGWRADRSRELLNRLLAWSAQPRFTLRHHWRRGDLVVWDNTGMLHRALPFQPTSSRLMHRTTLVGQELVTTL